MRALRLGPGRWRRALDGCSAVQLETKIGEERDGRVEVVDNDENVVHPLNHYSPFRWMKPFG